MFSQTQWILEGKLTGAAAAKGLERKFKEREKSGGQEHGSGMREGEKQRALEEGKLRSS